MFYRVSRLRGLSLVKFFKIILFSLIRLAGFFSFDLSGVWVRGNTWSDISLLFRGISEVGNTCVRVC